MRTLLSILILFFANTALADVNTWTLIGNIQKTNPKLSTVAAARVAAAIYRESEVTNVKVRTLYGVLKKESRFNPTAVNPRSGALGLGQILQQYHTQRMRRLGVSTLKDPVGNIRVTADIIAEYQKRFGKQWVIVYSGNGTAARSANYTRTLEQYMREL